MGRSHILGVQTLVAVPDLDGDLDLLLGSGSVTKRSGSHSLSPSDEEEDGSGPVSPRDLILMASLYGVTRLPGSDLHCYYCIFAE